MKLWLRFLRTLWVKKVRGKFGYWQSKWTVECSWGWGPDVELQFDKSCHLLFGLSRVEAREMARRLLAAADLADEMERGLAAVMAPENRPVPTAAEVKAEAELLGTSRPSDMPSV